MDFVLKLVAKEERMRRWQAWKAFASEAVVRGCKQAHAYAKRMCIPTHTPDAAGRPLGGDEALHHTLLEWQRMWLRVSEPLLACPAQANSSGDDEPEADEELPRPTLQEAGSSRSSTE